MLKGIAAAALIAGSFFLLKQRSPQRDDLTGMTALTAVCVIGSLAGQSGGGTVTEELIGGQSGEQFHRGDVI